MDKVVVPVLCHRSWGNREGDPACVSHLVAVQQLFFDVMQ